MVNVTLYGENEKQANHYCVKLFTVSNADKRNVKCDVQYNAIYIATFCIHQKNFYMEMHNCI